MSNEEDDKPTVVLDLNALKEELKNKTEVEAVDQDIEFAVHEENRFKDKSENTSGVDSSEQSLSLDVDLGEDIDLSEDIEQALQKVVFFDFQSEYFSKLVPKLPTGKFEFSIISQLKELNTILQSKESTTVIFNYNAAPKAVNQLTTQIKSKFPDTKTIIVAKGLSPEKAQAHKASKAGANAYLSVPFNVAKFEQVVSGVK